MSPSRQELVDQLGVAMQRYQRSTQAYDDTVGKRLAVHALHHGLPYRDPRVNLGAVFLAGINRSFWGDHREIPKRIN